MGVLDFLGFGAPKSPPPASVDLESLRKIVSALDEMEPDRARYVACFAYMLGRVANADLEITAAETGEMERIVEGLGGLPAEQAMLVVQIAKTQNKMFGATDGFNITDEFNRLASREQKQALLNCLFAVSSADQSISTREDNEIRQIARELRLDHEDFISARSSFREHLETLKKR